MTTYSGNILRIDTLTKDNYNVWCIQAEALLIKNDAWGYTDGPIERPIKRPDDLTSAAAARP